MQPKNHGAVATSNDLLSPSWYEQLDDAQFAQYIRYQYIRLREGAFNWDSDTHKRKRKIWDGGKDGSGTNHSAVWPKIAKAVRNFGVNPGVWVCAHFGPWAMRRQVINSSEAPDRRPTCLTRSASYDIYLEYCQNIKDFIANEFEMAGLTMARRYKAIGPFGLSDAERALYVVCDESYVTATPFFRHAFAAKFNTTSAVEKHLWPAATDYEPKMAFYDAAVPEWCVTEQLKDAVIEIRQYWKEYRG